MKLPDGHEVEFWGYNWTLTGAIKLHLHFMILNYHYNLENQKDEITSSIIDSECTLTLYDGPIKYQFKEVNTIYILNFDEQL